MKIKAIVSDFDGTLSSNHQVSDSIAKAIRTFIDDAYLFSIATGRAFEGVIEKTTNDLNLSDLHIVRGGSEIISRSTREVVWGRYIKPSMVLDILAYLSQQKDIYYSAEQGRFIYTVDGVPHSELGLDAEYKDLKDLPSENVPKIMLPPFQEKTLIETVYGKLKNNFPELHIVKTSSKKGLGIDINDGGAGKHMALLEYAKLMNLDPKEILGVGDGFNDYPLLTACGLKVAMGNATQELKEIADHIVATQENNGMLEVLELARSAT
jgi:Cof subfamily protein (haloacid dehalogenase superfamily)